MSAHPQHPVAQLSCWSSRQGRTDGFSFLSSARTCSCGKQTAPLMRGLARWSGQQGELAALLNGAGTAQKASWFGVSKSCLTKHPPAEGSHAYNLDVSTVSQNERIGSDLAKSYGISP